MAANSIERVNYYQGQYLGAEDFAAEQQYHRDMRRRHNLGPHLWGIVVGLELDEVPQEDGSGVDVFITPGVAIDGYGREIILLRPHKLDTSDFLSFALDDHYQVWLAYDEEETSRPDWGYGGCDDQFNRRRESFRVVVQPQDPGDVSIIVDGELVDLADEDNGLPPDLSVPYQELPADAGARWLVRLGNVRWNGSEFDTATEGQLSEGRVLIGQVAARILAPDAALVISDRFTAPLNATDEGVAVDIEGSLTVRRDITAKADIHVDGGQVDFRQSDGSGGEDFAISRQEATGGEDLRLQIPVADDATDTNRIVAGYLDGTDFNGVLYVTQSGNVGVHAGAPEHPLQIGDASEPRIMAIRGPDGNAEAGVLAFEDDGGATQRWFRFVHDTSANRLKLLTADLTEPIISFGRTTGRVGLSIDSPATTLHIADGSDVSLTGHGYLLIGDVDDSNIAVDDNEIQARDSGAASTLHLQAEGGALQIHSQVGSNTAFLVTSAGDVAIGNTSPQTRLHISGGADVSLSSHGYMLLGDVSSFNVALDNNEIQARNNGGASTLSLQGLGGSLRIHWDRPTSEQVIIDDDGDMGLGTTSPNAKLDVRGDIRLGNGGSMFAAGAGQTYRIVAGTSDGGSSGSGTGFTYSRTATGTWTVTFSPAFGGTPAVIATSNTDDDHTLSARSITSSSCQITCRDLSEGGRQNSSFSFVAIGPD